MVYNLYLAVSNESKDFAMTIEVNGQTLTVNDKGAGKNQMLDGEMVKPIRVNNGRFYYALIERKPKQTVNDPYRIVEL